MKKVCIDAGHGGHDSGAVGLKSYEKDHALAIALKVQKALQDVDVKTHLTRESDVFVALDNRSYISNSIGADAFVSIHMNSAANKAASGTEILYMNAKDLPLAKAVHVRLVQATGLNDRGIKYQNVSVVRKTNAPAILCEVAFVSNPSDESKLLIDSYTSKVAQAIADGICAFVGVKTFPSYQLQGSDGHAMDTLRVIEGTAFVAARKFGQWFGLSVEWDAALQMVALNGTYVEGVIIENGTSYIPIREAAKIAGLKLDVDDKDRIIRLVR